jgi:hypothetical protein
MMVGKVTSAYSAAPLQHPFLKILLVVICLLGAAYFLEDATAFNMLRYRSVNSAKKLNLLTWNIAAINNNPFEYWITSDDAIYNNVMKKVSTFIETPGANDVQVKTVFTETMAEDLMKEMTAVGWPGVEATRQRWQTEYRDRKIISEFIKDGTLGKKRLASMPDRVTNTINTLKEGIVTRPTVINCYNEGDLSTMDKWWDQWKNFIFRKQITVNSHGLEKSSKIYELITGIKKAKYPAITEEEEKISLPLQTLCAAIFDAILVHMMNTIEPTWQPLRENMCNKLNRKKLERTIDILGTTYADTHIQFLQEVASSFIQQSKGSVLASKFDIYSPAAMDTDRDQNSFILLRKNTFVDINEVTEEVLKELPVDSNGRINAPIMNGDLLALTAVDPDDHTQYLLASFHGDTNGLATEPIVGAVHSYALNKKPDHKLLFGLDANTYTKPEPDQEGVDKFGVFFSNKKLSSQIGQKPNKLDFTTFHARTHLQPQLNKVKISIYAINFIDSCLV